MKYSAILIGVVSQDRILPEPLSMPATPPPLNTITNSVNLTLAFRISAKSGGWGFLTFAESHEPWPHLRSFW